MSFFKTLLTLALLATSFSFAAEKQSVNFGVRGAFDYGIIYGMPEDDDIDGNPSGIGFEGGVSAKIPLIPNLAFTPEINIAYINTSHKYISYDRTYNSLSLDVPLLIRGTVAEKFYVAAGP